MSAEAGFDARRWRLVILGGLLVGLVLLAAIFAPYVAPYSPLDFDVVDMLQPPSGAHWLGTDELGRDVLSRAIFAARISMQVALIAVTVGLVFGTLIGMTAAYFGGSSTWSSCGSWTFSSRFPRSFWPSSSWRAWAPASSTR